MIEVFRINIWRGQVTKLPCKHNHRSEAAALRCCHEMTGDGICAGDRIVSYGVLRIDGKDRLLSVPIWKWSKNGCSGRASYRDIETTDAVSSARFHAKDTGPDASAPSFASLMLAAGLPA